MNEFLNIISEEWAIRALIASSLVGIMCGVIGTFMVLRNMSLIGDAVAHAILPGIFFAFVLVGYSTIGFFVGSLLAALFTAVAITWIQGNIKTKNDAAIGIVFTFMFSVGVIGISYLNNQQGVHLDLKDFLFGTILGISNEDIVITAFVTLYAIVSIFIFYRYLFITTFQPTIAATMGISVKLVHYFLMMVLSLAVVSALRTVGIILVVAMLITPPATALLWSRQLKNVLWLAALIGLLSAVVGLYLAILFDTTPGPAMCVVGTMIYIVTVFVAPTNGLIVKYWRRRQQSIQIEKEDIIKYLSKKKHRLQTSVHDLGAKLGIASHILSGRLKELERDGVVMKDQEKYTLSAKGMVAAKELVRAHRLWETFLVEQVGLSDTDIHDDAEKYEHLLSSEFLDQLDAKLGYPTRDPHGSPIPTKGIEAVNPLIRLNPKSKARISKDQMDDLVESRLWELGLSPEARFVVVKMATDYITIKYNNKDISIPAELALRINVE